MERDRMKLRVQTGRPEGNDWVQGYLEVQIDAADFEAAKAMAPQCALGSGVWTEEGEWLRVMAPSAPLTQRI